MRNTVCLPHIADPHIQTLLLTPSHLCLRSCLGFIATGTLCALILILSLKNQWLTHSEAPRAEVPVHAANTLAANSPGTLSVTPFAPGFDSSFKQDASIAPAKPHKNPLKDDEDECKDIAHQEDKCAYVRENCDDAAGIINYLVIRYCYNNGSVGWAVFVIFFLFVWLLILMSLLGSTADVFFVPALTLLSEELNLSPTVAGMTFLALGNGAPDIFTSLAAGQKDDIPLVMGELFGANVCITCFVLGSVVLAADVKLPARVYWRDYISYTAGVVIAIIICAIRPMHVWQPMFLLVCYIVYVTGTVTYIQYKRCKAQAQEQREREQAEIEAKTSALERIAHLENEAQAEASHADHIDDASAPSIGSVPVSLDGKMLTSRLDGKSECNDQCLIPCQLKQCAEAKCAWVCTMDNCPLRMAAVVQESSHSAQPCALDNLNVAEAPKDAAEAPKAADAEEGNQAERTEMKDTPSSEVTVDVASSEAAPAQTGKTKSRKQNKGSKQAKGKAESQQQFNHTTEKTEEKIPFQTGKNTDRATDQANDCDQTTFPASESLTPVETQPTESAEAKVAAVSIPEHHHHHHHHHHHNAMHTHDAAGHQHQHHNHHHPARQLTIHCCGLPHHNKPVIPEADIFGIEAELADHCHQKQKRSTSALVHSTSVNGLNTNEDVVLQLDNEHQKMLDQPSSDADAASDAVSEEAPEDDDAEVEVDHTTYLEGLSYPNPEWESKPPLLRTLNKIQFFLEYPFTILRWLTVPSPHIRPDRWGKAKTVFGLVSPIFISLVILINAHGLDGYSMRIGSLPLGVFCFLIGLAGTIVMSTIYFTCIRIDHAREYAALREREAKLLNVDEGARGLLDGQIQEESQLATPKEAVMLVSQADGSVGSSQAKDEDGDDRPPSVARFQVVVALMAFVGAVAWLNLIANEVVAVLQSLGLMFEISTAILGSTVLAIGNSIPDWISDTAVARAGHAQTAFASIFGAPLLTTFIGLTVALSFSTFKVYPAAFQYEFNSHVWIPWIFIAIAIVLNGIAFPYFNYQPPRRFGIIPVLVYAAFLGVTVITEVKS